MEPQWQTPDGSTPPPNVPATGPPPPPNAPVYGPPPYGPPGYGPQAYGPPQYGPPGYPPPGYGWAPQPAGPPTGPHVVWPVLLWGLAVVSLVGIVVCGFIAWAGFYSNSYLDDYGVTTTGTVTDLERFTDTVTVEFTTEEGEPATADIVWFTNNVPQVGDQVEITYDPYDPSYATEGGSDSDIAMAVIFIVLGAVGLAVMVGAIVGAVIVHRKRGKAKREGARW